MKDEPRGRLNELSSEDAQGKDNLDSDRFPELMPGETHTQFIDRARRRLDSYPVSLAMLAFGVSPENDDFLAPVRDRISVAEQQFARIQRSADPDWKTQARALVDQMNETDEAFVEAWRKRAEKSS